MEDHHVGAMMTRSERGQLPRPWESEIPVASAHLVMQQYLIFSRIPWNAVVIITCGMSISLALAMGIAARLCRRFSPQALALTLTVHIAATAPFSCTLPVNLCIQTCSRLRHRSLKAVPSSHGGGSGSRGLIFVCYLPLDNF